MQNRPGGTDAGVAFRVIEQRSEFRKIGGRVLPHQGLTGVVAGPRGAGREYFFQDRDARRCASGIGVERHGGTVNDRITNRVDWFALGRAIERGASVSVADLEPVEDECGAKPGGGIFGVECGDDCRQRGTISGQMQHPMRKNGRSGRPLGHLLDGGAHPTARGVAEFPESLHRVETIHSCFVEDHGLDARHPLCAFLGRTAGQSEDAPYADAIRAKLVGSGQLGREHPAWFTFFPQRDECLGRVDFNECRLFGEVSRKHCPGSFNECA